ncbi:MAG: amidohydrolase family protein [Rhodospirillales bacterium]
MSDPYPLCQGPDAEPRPVSFDVPAGAVDCHAHVFGPESRYGYSPARGYTPPGASLETLLNLHRTLGGIERVVLTQPSVYGTDNTCMMDAAAKLGERCRSVVALGPDVTDSELEELHGQGARGVRVNLVDKGGMPFDDINAVRRFTERIKDLGWHLEVLIHVHEFENLRSALNSMAVDVCVGHLGYMKTENGIGHPGFQAFLDLLRDGNCWVKLSGSYRVAMSGLPPYRDVEPFAKALIEANEERVLWGTDWPHPAFKGDMPNDGALMQQLATWAPDDELRHRILVSNPAVLYGF